MRKIVFIGSHLGYPMEKTPLGGGAMVGLQLVRHWPRDGRFELTALGSGPVAPAPVEYLQLAPAKGLVNLSEFAYARFCRQFEKAATDWVLKSRARFSPQETCVLVNDVSEGPTLPVLAQAGYPIVSIWHVDVVDYFNKLYLGQRLAPEKLTRLYEGSRKAGLSRALPDLLKLIFEKQRQTVAYSRRMIFPSKTMAETVLRCYGGLVADAEELARRSVIVPWGVWSEPGAGKDLERAEGLRKHYQIGPKTKVIMTLSRISPEKGLHLLLEALRRLENGAMAGKDICLLVCGEAAFMQGAAYMRRVKRAAAALRQVRVFFPGYLGPQDKAAYFSLADLFVSPSLHESYGLNVVEAMRAGLPILASDHYGVRDLLRPEFGRVVPYARPAEATARLGEALRELLADPERLKAMGGAARQAAQAMPFARAAERVLETALAAVRQ